MPAVTVIQNRRDTSTNWSTNNPILARGEIGYEIDTGKFKIGDSVSAWSSLAYGGLSGPQSTSVLESYGDGSDGTVSLSSGVTTLVRDMFYGNLTLTGTAQINTAGYRIFISGTLDISAAQAGAIFNNGGTGSNSASQTGGAVGTAPAGVTVGAGAAGTAGATGVVGAGVEGAASGTPQNGGATQIAGASGAGGPNAGGTAGAVGRPGVVPVNVFPLRRFEIDLLRGATLIVPGAGGPGGSAGSGDGTTVGNSCGGGGGGGGGGIVAIWANTINRGASTPVSCIQALGAAGGNGRNGIGTYTFTISTGNTAAVGSVYSNNGQNFTVTTAVTTASTTLIGVVTGSGVPLTSGTLTLVSGSGSSSIAFTVVAASSSAAAVTAGIGGAGGGSGGSGGWIYIQYNTLTGATGTNCLDASGGAGGLGGNGANNYTFTITAGATASVGATFTNNGQTFYVTTTLTGAQTTLVTVGTGAPTASGTLTKQTGTSNGNVTFSAFTGGTTAVGGAGGSGGNGGRITLLQVTTSTGSDTITGTGTIGALASGLFGGGGGVNTAPGGSNQVSL